MSGPSHGSWLFLCVALVTYLHVVAGVSVRAVNTTLRTLRLAFSQLTKGLDIHKKDQKLVKNFPLDISTLMRWLDIEASLDRSVCCPKCFKRYRYPTTDEPPIPQCCTRKETSRSRTCDEPLFRRTNVPFRFYSTQPFIPWLTRFLKRHEIENHLDNSVLIHQEPPRKPATDVWDGAMWRNFRDPQTDIAFTQTTGNLAFGIYVDWFNPFGNKIAGKKSSVGAIILFCLSLPPQLWYKLENICVIGITPGPNEPSVLQMNNVIDDVVAKLKHLWSHGISIPTVSHPNGWLIRVALMAAVCNLPALRKLIGYASHSARYFCSFCYLTQDSNHSLDYKTWTLRSHADHTQQAKAWRDAKTLKARDHIFETCGVQWSCLNEIEYWDPTKMVVVDTMHCISGMLEYHFRRVWNLDELGKTLEKKNDSNKTSAMLQEAMSTGLDTIMNNVDTDMRDDWEPLQLDLDDAMGSDMTSRVHYTDRSNVNNRGFNINPCTLTSLEEGLNEDDNDNNLYDDDGNELFIEIDSSRSTQRIELLGTEGLKKIRSVISNALIPSWMNTPPANLGSASHGKLQSSNWIVLFTIHLPLAIVSLVPSNIKHDVAWNVLHLCSLTEIVMNYQTGDQHIQDYFDHLVAYRSSLKTLRSDLKPTPNQHMAFHVPFQFYHYGPSAYLAAWPFEQYNGILQKIPNNRKICKSVNSLITLTFMNADLFSDFVQGNWI